MAVEQYNVAECASFLGQDVATVAKLIENGELPHQLDTGEALVDVRELIKLTLRRPEVFLNVHKRRPMKTATRKAAQ